MLLIGYANTIQRELAVYRIVDDLHARPCGTSKGRLALKRTIAGSLGDVRKFPESFNNHRISFVFQFTFHLYSEPAPQIGSLFGNLNRIFPGRQN